MEAGPDEVGNTFGAIQYGGTRYGSRSKTGLAPFRA